MEKEIKKKELSKNKQLTEVNIGEILQIDINILNKKIYMIVDDYETNNGSQIEY